MTINHILPFRVYKNQNLATYLQSTTTKKKESKNTVSCDNRRSVGPPLPLRSPPPVRTQVALKTESRNHRPPPTVRPAGSHGPPRRVPLPIPAPLSPLPLARPRPPTPAPRSPPAPVAYSGSSTMAGSGGRSRRCSFPSSPPDLHPSLSLPRLAAASAGKRHPRGWCVSASGP